MFDLDRYLKERAQLIDRELAASIDEPRGAAARLYEAMRYSLLAGGKRLRPVLVLASCEAVGGKIEAAMGLACAVEMIHTYSLIHDDLPCMDDDDFRRGRPTNHKVYGEAIATLAGDALLTDAFEVLVRKSPDSAEPRIVLETIAELANAAGSAGMVGGQVIDLLGEGKSKTIDELEELHAKKTGALFLASVRGGARLGGANESQIESLDAYARALGLAFQVVDDLLDVQGTPEQMGKRTQKDQERGKATYPAILGIERSVDLARELESRANRALKGFDAGAEPLRHLATFVVERKL
ncbi:MAG: polyprenyl synthetase family protein [Candidatus Binatus sp.]|uniref:polyprenyl synthetase family protein n=1 Tax=Candidatus Binatus sp. TaxID=2811406 RepID=UPI00272199C9|nr:farnesyl diphosphate synthase [Candidatus Binatus sp.]MDO8430835.1 polyprenyl synthetase family protein [Candidatus Binatus sp.]